MARRHGRLRSPRSYHRGGRAGNRRGLQCNIPTHITGEQDASNARQDELSQDQFQDTYQQNVRLGRMLQGRRRTGISRRGAIALAVGLATIFMATRALPQSRSRSVRRAASRPFPRFPKVVGIPRSRQATGFPLGARPVGAGGRITSSAADRLGARRARRRIRNLHRGPRSGGSGVFVTERIP